MIRKLKKEDYLDVYCLVENNRDYGFYITKNNKRILINSLEIVKEIIKDCIKYNEILLGYYKGQELKGILFTIGKKDKQRNYLKIYYDRNSKILNGLLDGLNWHCEKEIWAKIYKKNRHLINILMSKKCKFKFAGDRGSHILLKRDKRNYIPRVNTKIRKSKEE